MPKTTTRRYQFGPFEVDFGTAELRRRGIRVKLSGQPLHILEMLIERSGEVVGREELRKLLWKDDTFVDFERGLNGAVNRLREALGDSAANPRYIETLPRVGYRFVGLLKPFALQEPPESPSSVTSTVEEEPAETLPTRKAGGLTILFGMWAGIVCLAVVIAAWLVARERIRERIQPRIGSLAVLPFRNLSGNPSQEYLADGMTEALTGRLAEIHNLRVTSHTSVMRFRNPQLAVPEIAKMLGVDAVVEGSVTQEGNRIRVTAQLIRAATDEHFWSETYDREMQDALTLQSELAQSIAQRVEVTVTGEERQRLTAARPVAPEVYESYLKGRFVVGKGNRAEVEQSIRYFEDALNKDATFAPAYLGLAEAYTFLGTVSAGVPPEETRPKATSFARKALALDPNLVEAHVLLANVLQEDWQWTEAEAEYKRALELNPNNAKANEEFALWLLCQGHTDEAVARIEHARALDPVGVSGGIVSWILFQARRYDDAIRESRSALALQPDNATNLTGLGFALIADNKPSEAIPVLEKAVSVSSGSPAAIGVLIRAYAHAGRRQDALHLLTALKQRGKTGYIPAAAFVNAYLGLGDNEQIFYWLDRARKEKSNMLQFVKTHPYFDPIRGDSKFSDLVRRVGLE